jgi:hypothetical protein
MVGVPQAFEHLPVKIERTRTMQVAVSALFICVVARMPAVFGCTTADDNEGRDSSHTPHYVLPMNPVCTDAISRAGYAHNTPSNKPFEHLWPAHFPSASMAPTRPVALVLPAKASSRRRRLLTKRQTGFADDVPDNVNEKGENKDIDNAGASSSSSSSSFDNGSASKKSSKSNPPASPRRKGRPVGSRNRNTLSPAERAQRHKQHQANWRSKLRANAVSADPTARARAQTTLEKIRTSRARSRAASSEGNVMARAREALRGTGEWAMYERLRACRAEYNMALTKLRAYGRLPAAAEDGGGGEGGSSDSGAIDSGEKGGVTGTSATGAEQSADGERQERPIAQRKPKKQAARGKRKAPGEEELLKWTRQWTRGKQCARMMYRVGQEVARRQGALYAARTAPAREWLDLRRAWPDIVERWEELGDDELALDKIIGASVSRRAGEASGKIAPGGPPARRKATKSFAVGDDESDQAGTGGRQRGRLLQLDGSALAAAVVINARLGKNLMQGAWQRLRDVPGSVRGVFDGAGSGLADALREMQKGSMHPPPVNRLRLPHVGGAA